MTPQRGLGLAQAGVRRLHGMALGLLDEIGIQTDHAAMRDRLLAAGCRPAGERVRLPAALVASALAATPPGFRVYGRSTAAFVRVGRGGRTLFANTGIVSNILDLDSGSVRRTTLDDVRATTRLLDAATNVDAVYVSLVDATDVAPHLCTVAGFAAVLANTVKPLLGPGVVNGAEARAVVAVARAVRGGDSAALRRYPVCVPFICPISPLSFPRDIVDALGVIAGAGLPLDVVSNPVMGLTSPYTLAATVALGHAEVLAAAVMAYLIAPGLPILSHNTPSVADMRTMASTTGGPETGLMRGAIVRLARFAGLPAFVHGHTSSTHHDWQAGEEKARNVLLLAAERPAVLGGLGGMANVTLTSYESILLDDEQYGAVRRCLAGIQVDDKHLAFDLFAGLSDGVGFAASRDTIRRLRSGEVWRPGLAARQGLVAGAAAGETSVERAGVMARRMLATHEVEPLPAAAQAEIDAILGDYDRSCRS